MNFFSIFKIHRAKKRHLIIKFQIKSWQKWFDNNNTRWCFNWVSYSFSGLCPCHLSNEPNGRNRADRPDAHSPRRCAGGEKSEFMLRQYCQLETNCLTCLLSRHSHWRKWNGQHVSFKLSQALSKLRRLLWKQKSRAKLLEQHYLSNR